MNADLLLGVDIGGSKVAAVIARPSGQILKHLSTPTDLSGDAATVGGILRTIQAAMDAVRIPTHYIAAIGIGAPGLVHLESGNWFGSTNVRLTSPPVPLVALVEQRFGRPVFIENDVKAGTLGEHRFGAGKGLQHMVYLSLGTGIAAGVIVDGKLYRGVGQAGEIGHAPVERNGPLCNCGTHGCLEMMASGASIARRGCAALRAGQDTLVARLADGDPEAVTGRLVIQAAAQGDPVALDIMEETASYLAMGVLMIFAAYDPQLLVLAGGLAQAGDILVNPLRKALAEQATGHLWDWEDKLTLTALGDKAGALGAVALALQNVSPNPSDRSQQDIRTVRLGKK